LSGATPPLDAERIVEVLDRHGVEYVIVGGVGARLHGAGRMTYDLDLCPGWQPANLERLAAALRELDARLRDLPADVEFPPITGRTLREMMIGTWRTSAGDLDILREIPSGDRHRAAEELP
jgi:sugar phosphate isomerase/epimerase